MADAGRFYSLAPSLMQMSFEAPRDGPDVTSRVYVALVPIADSNALCTEYHYLHRGRTGPQIAYGVWYRGIGVGVVHFAYPRWTHSPYPEAPSPVNALECARVYISTVDRRGYPVGNAKGRRIEGLAVAAFRAACANIKQDWARKYPHLPMVTVLVSWSDNTRHSGRIYQLAGWRLDSAKVGARQHSKTWKHTSTTRQGNVTTQFHGDYAHDKSRWSLIVDDYFVRQPLEAASD